LTKYGSHILAAAKARNAENDLWVLSYLVATRRNCLSLLNILSMRLRSLYALKSQGGGLLRFAFGGSAGCRPDPVDQQFLAQEIAIITFVSEKQFRFADRHCQQVWNGTVIRRFATRQDEAERASLTVCAGVDFRRKATA